MGKTVADAVIDGALAVIATCTRLDVTSDSSTPTTLSNTLAHCTLTAGNGNGTYTIADGDTSGRKVTIAQNADIAVTGTGTANHIVLSLNGTILLTTTCTAQVLTSGNTVTVPAFADEIADPS